MIKMVFWDIPSGVLEKDTDTFSNGGTDPIKMIKMKNTCMM